MGWARALALLGALCAATTARAQTVEAIRGAHAANAEPAPSVTFEPSGPYASTPDARAVSPQPTTHLHLVGHLELHVEQRVFEPLVRVAPDASAIRGRAFAFGYRIDGERAHVHVRAGYRYGLPLDETRTTSLFDDGLYLTSGGTFALSVGTVAWLQLELDAFREVAGKRVMQLDAVPGLRFKAGRDAPVEGGVGFLATLKRGPNAAAFEVGGYAAVAQLAAQF